MSRGRCPRPATHRRRGHRPRAQAAAPGAGSAVRTRRDRPRRGRQWGTPRRAGEASTTREAGCTRRERIAAASPSSAPRPAGLGLVTEDDETQLRAPEAAPGRQTCLPTADHDNVPGLGHHDLHPPASNSPAPARRGTYHSTTGNSPSSLRSYLDGCQVRRMPKQEVLIVSRDEAEPCASAVMREPLTVDQAADLAKVFKAIGEPVRLRLLSLIASHAGGEACVCDLTDAFELSGPTISHHLKVLREAGVIEGDRRGTWIYYRVKPDTLRLLSESLAPAQDVAVTA